MDYDEQDQYGTRTADKEAALRCLEEALDLLSLEGPGISLDRVVELINRSILLIDRDYGYDETEEDFDPRRELDFNNISGFSDTPCYEED